MAEKVNIFWFRRDLRLHDNAGLYQALKAGLPVLPLFIFDKAILDELEDKADRRVSFIYQALQNIQDELQKHGSSLKVEYGFVQTVFRKMLKDYEVDTVFTNNDYEPYAIQRDKEIHDLCEKNNVSFRSFKDQVIFEKDEVTKSDGKPYAIYTPYYRQWASQLGAEDHKAFHSEKLLENLLPGKSSELPALETMGFILSKEKFPSPLPDKHIIEDYHKTRDIPGVYGTTRVGVHLRFGTISIRQLVKKALSLNEIYVKELAWREFFMQMLWQHPRLVNEACKKEYDKIKWRNNEKEFESWCQGRTGYPIVDAGMRELNETGFMHNRVRMITASFLVKHLLIDWRWGEAYFARQLLDYELSSNNGNWQWVAGCGCDAAPYFRVFNPELQAKKFDKDEKYIRQWVPEYGTAEYFSPIVDHKLAVERCLKAYKAAVAKG